MDEQKLKNILLQTFASPADTVAVIGQDGKYQATVVSAKFVGLAAVARQRLVYAAVGDLISSGEVHALSIKALTPQEKCTT